MLTRRRGNVGYWLPNVSEGSKMNWRQVGLSAALAACLSTMAAAGAANAALISGTLSLGGIVSYNTTTETINIGTSFVVVGTGDFSSFALGTPVSWTPTTSYANQDWTAGSNLGGCGGANPGCIFETTNGGGLTAAFDLDSYTTFLTPFLSIVGQGVMYLTGFDPTPGTFSITTQGPENVTVSFSATAVPGPVLGAGLPGLILACGALIALARRRRRVQLA
jgi:hypothetical protein